MTGSGGNETGIGDSHTSASVSSQSSAEQFRSTLAAFYSHSRLSPLAPRPEHHLFASQRAREIPAGQHSMIGFSSRYEPADVSLSDQRRRQMAKLDPGEVLVSLPDGTSHVFATIRNAPARPLH